MTTNKVCVLLKSGQGVQLVLPFMFYDVSGSYELSDDYSFEGGRQMMYFPNREKPSAIFEAELVAGLFMLPPDPVEPNDRPPSITLSEGPS